MMSFCSLSVLLVCLSSIVTVVQGHGYVATVNIGGKVYPGWDPNVDPYTQPTPARVIRKIPDDGPVLDVTDPSLACNVGGDAPAGLTAEAAAGSTVTFTMIRWPDDHLGPVDHYMASCEGSCTQFDATNAKWFKLDEDGYDNGVWASTKLIQNNLSASTTIPADLKPGEYLIRHEIIALHSPGQPQFYPACAQVKVTGSGTQSPSSADLVDIPGVYDTTVFPDIWADSFHSFTNPGPPVAFSSSGSNTGSEPVVSSSIAVPSSSSHVASSSVASSSKAPVQTSSVPSARPRPSSSVVSPPSQTSTGNGTCRSRKVRRQVTSERSVRHQAHGKRHQAHGKRHQAHGKRHH